MRLPPAGTFVCIVTSTQSPGSLTLWTRFYHPGFRKRPCAHSCRVTYPVWSHGHVLSALTVFDHHQTAQLLRQATGFLPCAWCTYRDRTEECVRCLGSEEEEKIGLERYSSGAEPLPSTQKVLVQVRCPCRKNRRDKLHRWTHTFITVLSTVQGRGQLVL